MNQDAYQTLLQDVRHLRAHDGWAALTLVRVAGLTLLAAWLSWQAPIALPGLLALGLPAFTVPPPPVPHAEVLGFTIAPVAVGWGMWALGQALMGLAMLQWFILLHDAGHRHFFTRAWANQALGTVASVFCLVPFFPWRAIHDQHHLWAGWQDLDPTSQATIPRVLPEPARRVVDFCWKWWLPLFTTTFGLRNFWNLAKLKTLFGEQADRRRHLFSIAFVLVVHAGLALALGAGWWTLFGLAFWVYFVISDPLLLSQHSHVPQTLSAGEKVLPYKLWEQDVFTRSIVCPPWMSRYVLLGFDVHVGHHLLPTMPSYHLQAVHARLAPVGQIDWWTWLRAAKALPGHVLVYQNRAMTGHQL